MLGNRSRSDVYKLIAAILFIQLGWDNNVGVEL